jgi:hypothetical protein
MYGFFIVIRLFNFIVPDTSKITTLGPEASQAARRLPGPLSFRLVTLITLPPRPAGVSEPNPSAPGKTGMPAAKAAEERYTALLNAKKQENIIR